MIPVEGCIDCCDDTWEMHEFRSQLEEWPFGWHARFDGVPLTDGDAVQFLDTRTGMIKKTMRDCDDRYDRYVVDPEGTENWLTEVLRGRVEIFIGDPDDPFEPPDSLLRPEYEPGVAVGIMRAVSDQVLAQLSRIVR